MFDALRERLEAVFDKLKGRGRLSEADVESALREVRRCLLEADVDYKVVKSLVDSIRSRAVGKDVLESITPGQQVVAVVYEELAALMGQEPVPLTISSRPPTVYLMVGLQGGGKTTTTVKIAKKLASGHKPLVVACDLRRPAAVDQLRVLAEQSRSDSMDPSPEKRMLCASSVEQRNLLLRAFTTLSCLILPAGCTLTRNSWRSSLP